MDRTNDEFMLKPGPMIWFQDWDRPYTSSTSPFVPSVPSGIFLYSLHHDRIEWIFNSIAQSYIVNLLPIPSSRNQDKAAHHLRHKCSTESFF